MKESVLRQALVVGSLLAVHDALAQVPSHVGFSDAGPGSYDMDGYVYDDGSGHSYVTKTSPPPAGNFVGISIKLVQDTIEITGKFTGTFSFTFANGATGPDTVTASVEHLALKLSSSTALSGGAFEYEITDIPISQEVIVPAGATGGSGVLERTFSFTQSMKPGVVIPSDHQFTLEWAMSPLSLTPGGNKQIGSSSFDPTISGAIVPEPSEYALLAGMGLVVFAAFRARKQ